MNRLFIKRIFAFCLILLSTLGISGISPLPFDHALAQDAQAGAKPVELGPAEDKPAADRPAKRTQRPAKASGTGRIASEQAKLAERANANTVSIVSGTAASSYFRIAGDLALVLDKEDELRVLPVQGRGGAQNAYDVLLLRGIDLGLVKADGLEMLQGDERIRDPSKQLAYIAKLFNDELHVVAPKTITDIRELEGKRVNFDVKLSGSDYTGRRIFELIGLKVEVSNLDQNAAMQALKEGKLDALVSVAPGPVKFISDIAKDSEFHFLPVPYDERLGTMYPPATLSAELYPNLVAADKPIDTVSVGTVLAVYNWPKNTDRFRRVARFVDTFFTNIKKFDNPARHPKWKEVNLAAEMPGWTRFSAAEEWLQKANPDLASEKTFVEFERFLDQRATGTVAAGDDERARLFKEFLEWQKQKQ
jgi:uncharacterized protein